MCTCIYNYFYDSISIFLFLAPKTTDDAEISAKIDTLLQMGITEVIGCTCTPD